MQLSNSQAIIEVSEHGAELTSFIVHDRQHIWQADPAFWRRSAPILFPIVGKVYDNTYRVDNQSFNMSQHGFARDSRFLVAEHTSDSATFILESTEESLLAYPYPFRLIAHYTLRDTTLHCEWTVENPSDQEMYFQIGAHPAFNFIDFDPQSPIYGNLRLLLHNAEVASLKITKLSNKGHALPDSYSMNLNHGILPITPTLFENDALVLEGTQVNRAILCDKDENPYLEMDFDAPVLGIWSPKRAPFCCIEPWYGRTDAEGFSGSIEQRQHIQHLAPHTSFTFNYLIHIF